VQILFGGIFKSRGSGTNQGRVLFSFDSVFQRNGFVVSEAATRCNCLINGLVYFPREYHTNLSSSLLILKYFYSGFPIETRILPVVHIPKYAPQESLTERAARQRGSRDGSPEAAPASLFNSGVATRALALRSPVPSHHGSGLAPFKITNSTRSLTTHLTLYAILTRSIPATLRIG
jgi:hypothetical protein